jgi:hypothetical protein
VVLAPQVKETTVAPERKHQTSVVVVVVVLALWVATRQLETVGPVAQGRQVVSLARLSPMPVAVAAGCSARAAVVLPDRVVVERGATPTQTAVTVPTGWVVVAAEHLATQRTKLVQRQ